MTRKSPTLIMGGLAGLVLIILLVYGCFVNGIGGQLFLLGIQHGIEDRHSGTTYSTDAPGWRMLGNGYRFTPADRTLLQKMVADGANVSRNSSIFIVGYRLGYNAVLFGIGLVIVIIGTIGLTLRQRRHAKGTAMTRSQEETSQ